MSSSSLSSLQLSRATGFSGSVANGVHLHPNGTHVVACSGKAVTVTAVDDPSDSVLLFDDSAPQGVSALAVSASGKFVVSGALDVVVWDLESGQLLHRLEEHDEGVSLLAISHDERFLLSVGLDGRLFVWELASGLICSSVANQNLQNLQCATWAQGCKQDAKGKITTQYLFATGGSSLQLWTFDPQSGQLQVETANTGKIKRAYTAIEFEPKGRYVYAGTQTSDVLCVLLRTAILKGHVNVGASVCSMAVMPQLDDTFDLNLLVGCKDGSVSLLVGEGDSLEVAAALQVEGAVTSTSLMATVDTNMLLMATDLGQMVLSSVEGVQSGDGELLMQAHSGPVLSLGVDGQQCASSGADGTLRVWDGHGNVSTLVRVKDAGVASAVALFDGVLIAGWANGTVTCHNESNQLLWHMDNVARSNGVSAIAVSDNRKMLLSGGGDGSVRLWDASSQALMVHFADHASRVNRVRFLWDDALALTCSDDRTAMLFDLKNEKKLGEWEASTGAVNDVDVLWTSHKVITFVCATQDGYLRVFASDAALADDHLSHKVAHEVGEITCVCMAPQGGLVAVGSRTGMVAQYAVDAKSGFSLVASSHGHSSTVTDVAFVDDARGMVSVGDDGSIMHWSCA